MHDPIADLVVTIRNGAKALHDSVTVYHSRLKESVAAVLVSEGFVESFSIAGDKVKSLTIRLKYSGKTNAITQISQVSKPGLRRYTSSGEIPKVLGGMGVVVLSTSKGVMTGVAAAKARLGGEVICTVW